MEITIGADDILPGQYILFFFFVTLYERLFVSPSIF